MASRFTVGVLSPFLGGWYFGGLLDAIGSAAAQAGGRIVAFQTLDAGTDIVEVSQPPDPACPVSWERLSGFLVVINAVSADCIAAIEAAGKPVVVISYHFPGLACPVVLPDNRTGIGEAVGHLVGHGHRRIAFVGHLDAGDVAERYDAYRSALLGHGIEPDPGLLFAASDNHQAGGDHAARAMLAAGLPSTAAVVGTDANAVGVLRTLAAAGCRLPADQAVVAFDDMPAAAAATPRLTTVRQPVTDVARRAVELLLERIRTGRTGYALHAVPTSLVVRESCGCPPTGPAHPEETEPDPLAGPRSWLDDTAVLQAALCTQYEVSMDLLHSHENDPRALRWLARTSATAGCLGLWTEDGGPTEARPTLEIVGTFATDPQLVADVPPLMAAAAFPPEQLLAAADRRPGSMVFVIGVKAGADLGMLAITDTVETRSATGREPISQWTALLAVALEQHTMLATLRARDDQLRAAALYDHLTGLPNRALFLDRLDQAMRRHHRAPGGRFAVLFLDLDGFKVVNDSLGHSAGDQVLIQVADRLKRSLRDCDTAARFGGDEFLVLLDGLDGGHVPVQVAERLQAALATPFQAAGHDVVIAASIGIALGGDDYASAEELLRDADIAMYSAKSERRGSHALFDVTMHSKAVARLTLETELRQALEDGGFELHYQPIVDLRSGRVRGFEALVRWRHAQRGLVPPDSFLPIAEETGLIVPLSRWILQEAGRRCAQWQAAGAPDRLSVSVNVANRQFWHGGLIDDLADVLHRTGLDPGCLALEITEGVVMHNVDLACKVLDEVHTLGCPVHIDDFGTGYSSLEALHRLPIDALKVDRSFVSRLGADARSSELVRTIVLMGHNLGIELVAEGIETERQRALLVELDCPLGQGFLFSRPVPAAEAAALAVG